MGSCFSDDVIAEVTISPRKQGELSRIKIAGSRTNKCCCGFWIFFISFLGFPLQPHADRPRCCGASWWRAAAAGRTGLCSTRAQQQAAPQYTKCFAWCFLIFWRQEERGDSHSVAMLTDCLLYYVP